MGTEVSNPHRKQAMTKRGMMSVIRHRRSNGELSSYAPSGVRSVIDIIPDWPTVPFGECGYLTEALSPLEEQYDTLRIVLSEKDSRMFGDELSNNDVHYLRFGRNDKHLQNGQDDLVDHSGPPHQWEIRSALKMSTLDLDLATASPSVLKQWV